MNAMATDAGEFLIFGWTDGIPVMAKVPERQRDFDGPRFDSHFDTCQTSRRYRRIDVDAKPVRHQTHRFEESRKDLQ